jgi:hypothetical protein
MSDPHSNLQIICLESDAFQALVKEAAGLLKEEVRV